MENIIELLIGFRDKAVVTRGFLDTGNNLYDRVTGKPIVVAAPDIIKKLYSKTYGSILSFYFNGSTGEIKDLDNFQNRIHMISYSTISRKDNVMPAFDCDFFFLGSKLIKARPLIGMSMVAFGNEQKSYSVLLHNSFSLY